MEEDEELRCGEWPGDVDANCEVVETSFATEFQRW